MRAQIATFVAICTLGLALAVNAIAASDTPPSQDLPADNATFTSGDDVTLQGSVAAVPVNPIEMQFYLSKSNDTNGNGVLFKGVDTVSSTSVTGGPSPLASTYSASWPADEPGTWYWQSVYVDCTHDVDCFNESTPPRRSFTVSAASVALLNKGKVELDTFLTKHPKHRTHKRKVTFKFNSNVKGAHFRCLYAHGWSKCDSPHVFRHLSPGRYKFKAQALVNGTKDTSPASWTFRILR
jgi:hypothetical protein